MLTTGERKRKEERNVRVLYRNEARSPASPGKKSEFFSQINI